MCVVPSSTPHRSHAGSSGGPVVDARGNLVGIDTHRVGDGFYLALPADEELRARVEALSHGDVPRRPRLGIAVAPPRVARRLRQSVGLAERDGLLIHAVEEGGPADRAGLAQGDLVVRVAGTDVSTVDELAAALEGAELRGRGRGPRGARRRRGDRGGRPRWTGDAARRLGVMPALVEHDGRGPNAAHDGHHRDDDPASSDDAGLYDGAEALDAYSRTVTAVAERLVPSVAGLRVHGGDARRRSSGSGSAVVISEDGLLLTSAHVVAGSDRGTVTFSSGEESDFEVIGTDRLSDLAVVRVERERVPRRGARRCRQTPGRTARGRDRESLRVCRLGQCRGGERVGKVARDIVRRIEPVGRQRDPDRRRAAPGQLRWSAGGERRGRWSGSARR